MGQKPPKVIYGRQVPEAVSRNSFRDMVRQKAFKFGVVVAGALSLASSQPEPEPQYEPALTSQIANDRVKAEEAAIEQAYGNMVIIPVEFMNEFAENPNSNQVRDNGQSLQPYFKLIDRDRVYQDILDGFNGAGEFDPEAPNKASASVYMPEDHPEELETNNERVAHTFATSMVDDMIGGSLGVARPVLLTPHQTEQVTQANGIEHVRGCAVVVMPESMSADDFVERFSRVGSMQSVERYDVADFHQAIANHEFTHCVTSRRGMPTWKNESMADMYAVARHIQINGDDGFAQAWRDMRNMNVISIGDTGHDTVPMLDRAIPVLLEAERNGDLDNLNPKQLFEYAMGQTARSQGQTIAEMFDDLEVEVNARGEAFKDMEGAVKSEGGVRTLDIDAARAKGLSTLEIRAAQRVQASWQQSFENIFEDPAAEEALFCEVGSSLFEEGAQLSKEERAYAMARYRDNLDNLIATQENTREAYEAVSVQAWRLNNQRHRLVAEHGAEEAVRRQATERDRTGLTAHEKAIVLEGYRLELEIELGIDRNQPQQTQERDLVS